MFGMLLSQENLPTILQTPSLREIDKPMLEKIYLGRKFDSYFVQNYVNRYGDFSAWTVLPAYSMKNFEYDPEQIKSAWTEMTRK